MQVDSSITIVPAEPSIEPALATPSKSIGMSISSGRSTGVEEPPGTTALSLRPPAMPCA